MKVRDCFNEKGNVTFDPYRCDPSDPRFQVLFDEDGYLHAEAKTEVARLVKSEGWGPWCDAVGVIHAERHASGCKGSYSTIYFWRYSG